jgi:predicted DNA-binding protein (UPF0251 family)
MRANGTTEKAPEALGVSRQTVNHRLQQATHAILRQLFGPRWG